MLADPLDPLNLYRAPRCIRSVTLTKYFAVESRRLSSWEPPPEYVFEAPSRPNAEAL